MSIKPFSVSEAEADSPELVVTVQLEVTLIALEARTKLKPPTSWRQRDVPHYRPQLYVIPGSGFYISPVSGATPGHISPAMVPEMAQYQRPKQQFTSTQGVYGMAILWRNSTLACTGKNTSMHFIVNFWASIAIIRKLF